MGGGQSRTAAPLHPLNSSLGGVLGMSQQEAPSKTQDTLETLGWCRSARKPPRRAGGSVWDEGSLPPPAGPGSADEVKTREQNSRNASEQIGALRDANIRFFPLKIQMCSS